jgi:hypothetical protein
MEKTHRNDWDFSETLFWGSLKIVGVADRLVGNHPNKILEKRGFSLFCHECLLVIGCR